jgi:hypothetical protein
MFGQAARPRLSTRTFRSIPRVLCCETLETRTVLSESSAAQLAGVLTSPSVSARVKTPPDAAQTVAPAITVNGGAAVAGRTAALSALGTNDGGESKLISSWSVTGTYSVTVKIIDAGGLSVSNVRSIIANQTWTSTKYPSLTTHSRQILVIPEIGPSSAFLVSSSKDWSGQHGDRKVSHLQGILTEKLSDRLPERVHTIWSQPSTHF